MTEASTADGGCPACAVAAGRVPAHIVHESDRLVAYLDPAPIRPGHLRIVPRAHFPHFNALPVGLARELLDLGERLAAVQRAAFKVDRVGFLFPARLTHAQVHAVPLLSAGDVAGRRPAAAPAVPASENPAIDLAETARHLRRGLLAAESMGAMPRRPLPASGVLVG